jgi:uncharacterized protein
MSHMTDRTLPPAFIVDVFELARTGGQLEGTVEPGQLLRLADTVRAIDGPLRYAFGGSIDDLGRPAARLHVHGRLTLTCDRCNGPLQTDLEAQGRFFFVETEAALNAIPIDESEVDALLGSPGFDLLALIEDEAILALPLSPRHVDCRAPQLDAPEPETEPERRSPFAVLEQLKVRKH